jgi:Fe-S cluster biogenesis protein NfuA/nitrite reductase/ring-hydroxylating ferredoxin subunit
VDDAGRTLIGRVEGLLEEVEALADPVARQKATEVAQVLLELYGEGLGRLVDGIGQLAPGTMEALATDDLVGHLLLLHGLHPVPLEVRVGEALDGVRPYLESHGGGVELVSIDDHVVHLRLQGSCQGCPSSAMTLKLAVEKAIQQAAPDVDGIETEGAQAPAAADPGLIQLTVSPAAAGGPPPADDGWATAGGLPQLAHGGTLVREVAGEPLLFARVGTDLYAYRSRCPSCAASLEGAALADAELSCPACASRFDARRAGRGLDQPHLYLDPVPLLESDAGLVRVAAGAAA